MNLLSDVAMIAAETGRSRAYLQAMVQFGLAPSHLQVLPAPPDAVLPGQTPIDKGEPAEDPGPIAFQGLAYAPGQSLERTIQKAGIPSGRAVSFDINHPDTVAFIEKRPETCWIYSGYGGGILGKRLLNTGRRFLHVHGGYLPDYKGSTANYYSLLCEGTCGASAIFLTERIDAGPILMRRRFPPPAEPEKLDQVYDALYRAVVLVETLTFYRESGRWPRCPAENFGGRTYYVMHPVLRHIALLSQNGCSRAAG